MALFLSASLHTELCTPTPLSASYLSLTPHTQNFDPHSASTEAQNTAVPSHLYRIPFLWCDVELEAKLVVVLEVDRVDLRGEGHGSERRDLLLV